MVATDAAREATGITRTEIVAALSLASDIAMGQPLESGLDICRIALTLSDEAGLDDAERVRVFHVALLRHVGCTAENAAFASIIGDEIAFRHGGTTIDMSAPRAMGAYMLRHLVRTNGLLGTAAKLVEMAGARDRLQSGVLAVCEVAELLAAQLGLGDDIQRDLYLFNERWDGKSFLKRVKGEDVPVADRVVQIAECASVYRALGGPEAAVSVVRERAGSAFDPRLSDVLARKADTVLARVDDSLWDVVLAAAPADDGPLEGEALDAALEAVAEFVDLKSSFTVGHSSGVARLAAEAGRHAGLPDAEVATLRAASLVHDLGRVGVSSTIWEKPGPLNADEWERVRLHPYHGERALARSRGLARLAAIASRHHERCDGTGYHRGLDARSLSQTARLLAAADVFHAMTEPRPHRAALEPARAAEGLRDEARAGRLDGDAVACVLVAAGEAPRRRREHVAGLTARELEVLRLLARGLSTREIASHLVVTPKTADSHIQHIYAKAGVSTRAAATVFAMRHDLLDTAQSSGELPM
ncbi:MAG TPA: HD domain-containing phosphohydrolase [Solirubrobacteraceae bacterium]